jgi:hypothetical protein
MTHRLLRLGALALIALPAIAGCAKLHMPFTKSAGHGISKRFSQEDLRSDLTSFVGTFSGIVRTASEDISAATKDRTIRRRTVLWRLRVIPAIQTVAFQDNAQQAYVLTLTLCTMMQQYLTRGDGRDLFGPQQPIAVAAADEIERQALDIGSRFLSEKQLEKASKEVAAVAERYPITGRDFSFEQARGAVESVREGQSLTWLLTLPLSPFRAFEGVDAGAKAISDFNQTAREFSAVVQQLPDALRLQSELLLYDVEDRETVVQGLAAFESMARSAEQASATLERLPEDLRTTLADSKDAIAEANQALASAQALAGPLAQAAEQVKLAGDAWNALINPKPEPQQEPSRPFDIREYAATARDIGAAAAQLQGLTDQLHQLVESKQLETAFGPVSSAVGDADARARALVDRAAWRGAELLLLLFALLLAYRALAPRIARAR